MLVCRASRQFNADRWKVCISSRFKLDSLICYTATLAHLEPGPCTVRQGQFEAKLRHGEVGWDDDPDGTFGHLFPEQQARKRNCDATAHGSLRN